MSGRSIEIYCVSDKKKLEWMDLHEPIDGYE